MPTQKMKASWLKTVVVTFAASLIATAASATEKAVARLGTTDYPSVQDAFSAAASNDVVTLIADVVWTNTTETTLISVADDKQLSLDLAGHSLVATNSLADATAFFTVCGDLTITDSSEAKTGLIAFAPISPASYAEGSPEYASRVFRMAGGRLTLLSGTIEHQIYASACYIFDAGGLATDASEIVISGAVIRAQCSIARLWATDSAQPERFTLAAGSAIAAKGFGVEFFGDGESGTAEIVMTGGEIKAPYCVFYLWRPRGGVTLDLRDGLVEGTLLNPKTSTYAIYEMTPLEYIPARGHNRVRISGMTIKGAGGCYFGDYEGSTDIEITSSKISASCEGLAAVKVYDEPIATESATLTITDSVLEGSYYSLWLEDAGACRVASLVNSTVTSDGIAVTYYGPTSQSGPAKGRGGSLVLDGGTVAAPYALFLCDDYASTSISILDGAFDGAFCLCGRDLEQSDFMRRDGKPWVAIEGGTFTNFSIDTDGAYSYIDGENLSGIVLSGGTYDARLSLDEPTEFARVAHSQVYKPSAEPLNGGDAWDVVQGVAVYAQPIDLTTWQLYTSFNEAIPSNYLFAATNDSVTAVWTVLPGYEFNGGATAHTNSAATVCDPTCVSPFTTLSVYAFIQIGDDAWAYIADGTCTITGTGATWAKNEWTGGNNPLKAYDAAIKNLVVQDGITGLGANSFENMLYVQDVDLAASVTAVGDRAFKKCYGLTNVTSKATGASSVGDYTFSGCHSLQGLTFAGTPTFGTQSYTLQAAIYMKDGGIPEVYAMPTITVASQSEHIMGKKTLNDAEWTDVTNFTDEQKKEYHFFKIEMK